MIPVIVMVGGGDVGESPGTIPGQTRGTQGGVSNLGG